MMSRQDATTGLRRRLALQVVKPSFAAAAANATDPDPDSERISDHVSDLPEVFYDRFNFGFDEGRGSPLFLYRALLDPVTRLPVPVGPGPGDFVWVRPLDTSQFWAAYYLGYCALPSDMTAYMDNQLKGMGAEAYCPESKSGGGAGDAEGKSHGCGNNYGCDPFYFIIMSCFAYWLCGWCIAGLQHRPGRGRSSHSGGDDAPAPGIQVAPVWLLPRLGRSQRARTLWHAAVFLLVPLFVLWYALWGLVLYPVYVLCDRRAARRAARRGYGRGGRGRLFRRFEAFVGAVAPDGYVWLNGLGRSGYGRRRGGADGGGDDRRQQQHDGDGGIELSDRTEQHAGMDGGKDGSSNGNGNGNGKAGDADVPVAPVPAPAPAPPPAPSLGPAPGAAVVNARPSRDVENPFADPPEHDVEFSEGGPGPARPQNAWSPL